MYLPLKELTIGKPPSSDELTYDIKKFIRKKLNQAFNVYMKKNTLYSELSFKRAKVKFMLDWGIDEYTAYHITEPFDEEISYIDFKGETRVAFPKRGKNIAEDLIMKILSNMDIDPIWFFMEPLSSPVRMINPKITQLADIKNEITIPIYNDLKQLTESNPLTVSFNRSILQFLGLSYINSNEKHPIFQYYNYVFAKVNNSYYLTDLWDQDLRENEKFLVYKKSDMSFEILKYQEVLLKTNEVFTLGRVLTVLEKLIETI